MLCEHERSALTDAAAAGELTEALRRQLASCEHCRAAFAEEQVLFAAVASGLHTTANAQIPPSLVHRLRAVAEPPIAVPPNRKLTWRWFGAAAAFAALAMFLAHLPRSTVSSGVPSPLPVSSAQLPARAVTAARAPAPRFTRDANSGSRSADFPAPAPPTLSAEPLVIVPPEEREAYLRFLLTVQEHADVARALAVQPPAAPANDLTAAAPLAIAQLEIKRIEPQVEEQAERYGSVGESGSGER